MKRLFTIFCMIMLMCMMHVNAEEIPTSGKCGTNAVWSYADGVLTISGSGPMEDFRYESRIPWMGYTGTITKVVIEDGITNIVDYAFSSCSLLSEVEIPESVTQLGRYAFYKCEALTEIDLPKNVTDIGEWAFARCGALMEIDVPKGVTVIDRYVFNGCNSLEKVKLGDDITQIAESAFHSCVALREIDLPQNLEYINGYAFYRCTSLKKIEIPKKVIAIDKGAFKDCSGLTELKLPQSLTRIGDDAFYGCGALQEVKLPSGLTSIGASAFIRCLSLKEIEIPESVKEVGDNAFAYCSALTKVSVPSGLNIIYGMFMGCTSLTEFEVPEGATSISGGAFFGCSSLSVVKLPESMERINFRAFYNCSALNEINLPDNITYIGDEAFYNCSSLTKINLSPSITQITESAFYNCSSLTEITLPEQINKIAEGTFEKCSSLTEITVPEAVTSIGKRAFANCGELSVFIPPGVETMEENIFGNTKATVYARPESVAYGYSVKAGQEVRDYYIPEVGEVIDAIIDSDIYVTMNGRLIPSYCINGKTLILLRDLERYGFDVNFDSSAKIAYATLNPDKAPYEGEGVKLYDRNVLYTDIRAIINGVEVEVRNTNGFIAVEAERLGNYVPQISCIWQPDYRRLQMQAFTDMASFNDLLDSISSRIAIPYSTGCNYFADTDDGRYDVFVDKSYIDETSYNGYIYPMRGLSMYQFLTVAGRVYFGPNYNSTTGIEGINEDAIPDEVATYVRKMYNQGIVVPDESGSIYFDGILTREQMEYYLDVLEQG